MIQTFAGQEYEECYPYPCHPCDPCDTRGCYAPWGRDVCNTVHIRLWVNATTDTVPPVTAPTYEGNADWRITERRRVIIAPGSAMLGSAGIGATGKTTYLVVVDDVSGQPMAWFKVVNWSFHTAAYGINTNAVDWIAFEVEHT